MAPGAGSREKRSSLACALFPTCDGSTSDVGRGPLPALIAERCAPIEVQGIDPSEGQLASRACDRARSTRFRRAMRWRCRSSPITSTPPSWRSSFSSSPTRRRRGRNGSGGSALRTVAAYAWDVLGGGFPFDPIWQETRAAGVAPILPPNPSAGGLEALRRLWTAAGTSGGRNARDRGGAHVCDLRGLLGDEHDHRGRAPATGGDVAEERV